MAGFLHTRAPRFRGCTLASPSRSRAPARSLALPRLSHVTLIDSPAPPLSFSPTFPSTVPISASRCFPLAGFGVPRLLQEQFLTEPGRTRLAEEGWGWMGGETGEMAEMEASGVGEEGGRGRQSVRCRSAIGSEEALRQHPTLGTAHAIG